VRRTRWADCVRRSQAKADCGIADWDCGIADCVRRSEAKADCGIGELSAGSRLSNVRAVAIIHEEGEGRSAAEFNGIFD